MSDNDRIPGLSELRDVAPPPSLVPRVMRRITEPRPTSFWSWLRKPRRLELRVSPLGALAAATAGVLGLVVLAGSWSATRRDGAMVLDVPAAQDATVIVRFMLVADGAKRVTVAGDFNGWDPEHSPLSQDGSTFSGTVRLPPGAHEYMFVVDGKWVTDPAAAEHRPDGFGRNNAVLRL
jgi:Glycogen recognition site of AMP-activated protein kinase